MPTRPEPSRTSPSRRRRLGNDLGSKVEPPAGLEDGPILAALGQGAAWLRSSFGSVEVPYGRYFRVGREGGDRSWPVGGGTLKDQAMATPRAISFGPAKRPTASR